MIVDDDEPPAAAGQVKVRRLRVASQPDQVAFLRAMVDRYRANQLVREKAIDIVFREARCAPKAKACHALAIGEWVQRNVTYVNEGIETFQTPVRTLTWRYGDCDDFTTLICSLLEAIGIRSELVALKWRGQFRHIFPRAVLPAAGGKLVRMPLDATLRQPVVELTNPIRLAVERGDHPETLVL